MVLVALSAQSSAVLVVGLVGWFVVPVQLRVLRLLRQQVPLLEEQSVVALVQLLVLASVVLLIQWLSGVKMISLALHVKR